MKTNRAPREIVNNAAMFKSLDGKFQKRSDSLVILKYFAPPQPRQSILKKGFPVLPRWRVTCPNWDYSARAQSSQYMSDEALLFVTGLGDSNFLLPDAVAKPLRKHRKNPNVVGASHDTATDRSSFRIRIYSCIVPLNIHSQSKYNKD